VGRASTTEQGKLYLGQGDKFQVAFKQLMTGLKVDAKKAFVINIKCMIGMQRYLEKGN
jgi:hypothetical protein